MLSVSLDTEKQRAAWLKAIQADGLPWPQVGDAEGFRGSTAGAYSIRSIPQNFLLDRQGRIVAANLHGEALAQKLSELLSEAH